ncbi:MAG: class I SAM-dependent methyltransferase [Bacteroidales bacterium]|nr:class I SAM-dependent methyltransferase [Bacteroidales bacterium]
MSIIQTAERHSAKLPSDNVMHQRHMIAYFEAAKRISGQILEIGSGEGYGIEYLSPKAEIYTAVDKFPSKYNLSKEDKKKVHFHQMSVPPLKNIAANTFDFVVSFQVIEHIKDDNFFIREIYRVLKPGGKLILTTPNRKMSLTRNPWHIREYISKELQYLTSTVFDTIDIKGIFGSEKVMKYYQANKESVARITRFDILNLQYRLPRQLLQIPYDILNRINRNKLHKTNTNTVNHIQLNDFYLGDSTEGCFDFFVIAEKKKG